MEMGHHMDHLFTLVFICRWEFFAQGFKEDDRLSEYLFHLDLFSLLEEGEESFVFPFDHKFIISNNYLNFKGNFKKLIVKVLKIRIAIKFVWGFNFT